VFLVGVTESRGVHDGVPWPQKAEDEGYDDGDEVATDAKTASDCICKTSANGDF
jgi:hypothetical protein